MKPLSKNKIAGFTLIELMIAMAVTMILLYAAMNAFRDATNSNQVVTQSSDMSDNLRTGLNLIELDLQQAGAGIPLLVASQPPSTAPSWEAKRHFRHVIPLCLRSSLETHWVPLSPPQIRLPARHRIRIRAA
jgi:prepilin-type N-terminal cleavage/methylation domain-containing protein